MSEFSGERLRDAVAAICGDVAARAWAEAQELDDRRLWWELSCCVLSSRVPYETAVAAADAIDLKGLLHGRGSAPGLAYALQALLSVPVKVGGAARRYRFPACRAAQLAAAHAAVDREGGIARLLRRFPSGEAARDWLVANAPGLGPKQASMFLRNAGISYDLAVLDRHVLAYMAALRLSDVPQRHVSGLRQYTRLEADLREHARGLGHAVGLLDWAIWIVMRAAGSLGAEPSRA